MIRFYTGFRSYKLYKLLCSFIRLIRPSAQTMKTRQQVQRQRVSGKSGNTPTDFNQHALIIEDQILMFLCKIRQAFFVLDLADRFKVSISSVSQYLITWANFLYFTLGVIPIWPSKEMVIAFMPDCFKQEYPSTRVILYCSEIHVQSPSSLVLQLELYSTYKSHTTYKGLVGIAPTGSIVFVSHLYTGCISDKEITRVSGILDLIEEGDSVMADKGFEIADLLSIRKASLNIPPFLNTSDQFTAEDVEETQSIAQVRINVERAIRRIKEYHIFNTVLPLSLAGSINQIWTVACL